MIGRSRRAGWLVIAIVALAAGTLAAAQARDSRDAARPATIVGSGSLAGRVVTPGDNPTPVRRAIVTVTGEGLKHGRTTVTDDNGAFAIAGLPAGRFQIAVTKPAHLPAAYGAHQPGRPGVPILLNAGERRDDLRIVMARAAVVSGVLRSPKGEPAAGIEVSVFRVPPGGQNIALIPAGSTTTDDRGMYRVFDLAPGEYVVAAALRRMGGTGDAEAWTSAQIDRVLAELKQRSPVAVTQEPRPAEPAESADARVAWAPVYFPGSASAHDAVPIRLRAGDERTGVDFTVSLTRMAKVEGVLLGDPDLLSGAQFFFNATGRRLQPLVGMVPTFSSRMTPSGKVFTYTGVAPGTYSITAHLPGSSVVWSRSEFQVSGADILDLAMTPQAAPTFSGRIQFEGLDAPPPGALKGATVRLSPDNGMGQSSSGGTRMGNPLIPLGVVSESGEFQVTGVVPDTFTVDVRTPGAPGWTARSVIVNGRDALDGSLPIAGDVAGVVVTMTQQPTRLSGRIATAAGAPGASLFITVFPQDRALWRPLTRRITSARADTDGGWHVDALPPGDYFVVALMDLAPTDLHEPGFLDQLVPAAVKITLAPGERKTQDLVIGSPAALASGPPRGRVITPVSGSSSDRPSPPHVRVGNRRAR